MAFHGTPHGLVRIDTEPLEAEIRKPVEGQQLKQRIGEEEDRSAAISPAIRQDVVLPGQKDALFGHARLYPDVEGVLLTCTQEVLLSGRDYLHWSSRSPRQQGGTQFVSEELRPTAKPAPHEHPAHRNVIHR